MIIMRIRLILWIPSILTAVVLKEVIEHHIIHIFFKYVIKQLYNYLENSPKKARALIGLKSCLYNSMETQN